MRTTIDIPDSLMVEVKKRIQQDRVTFRSLVITSLQKTLEDNSGPFELKDASVGNEDDRVVDTQEINEWIERQREPRFQP